MTRRVPLSAVVVAGDKSDVSEFGDRLHLFDQRLHFGIGKEPFLVVEIDTETGLGILVHKAEFISLRRDSEETDRSHSGDHNEKESA